MAIQYSKKVLDLFKKPKNYGKIKNADGMGQAGNLTCGDVMAIYIKVGLNAKKEEIIKDIKFETFGCVAAIATSSIITTLAKGKTLVEALNITKENVINTLEGLPPVKIHCSLLSTDALFEAIYDYYTANHPELINKEMNKKHLKIQTIEEEIEGRYTDWIKEQKKELEN